MTDVEFYVSPEVLIANLDEASVKVTGAWNHANDSDSPDDLTLLLVKAGELRKQVGELYRAVELALVTCSGSKKFVVDGVGPVEILKRTRRTGWRHNDLWRDLLVNAQEYGAEPVSVLFECVSPSWRLKALAQYGIEPSDYCIQDDDGWSVKLPAANTEADPW